MTITPYAVEVLKQIDNVDKKLRESEAPESLKTLGLRSKAEQWKEAALAADKRMSKSDAAGSAKRINGLLMNIERLFVAEQGLPGREWYKHRVVAASGYASVGLPGITGAIEQNDWLTAEEEMDLFGEILDSVIETTKQIGKE